MGTRSMLRSDEAMAILSRAAEGRGSAEGAETSGVSPNDNPRRRAPGTLDGGDPPPR